MSITRAPRPATNFYILDKRISEDPRLGWAAKGLLVFLLGKPDHWEVSVQALVNETEKAGMPTGRDGVRRILQELENAGYVQKAQAKDGSGRFGIGLYVVSEIPTKSPAKKTESTDKPAPVKPSPAKPSPVNPAPGNPPQVRTDLKQGLKEASTPLPPKADLAAVKPKPIDPLADAVSAWNAICGKRCGTVMKLSPPRAKSLALRLTELGGAGGWVAFCQRVNQSPFLTGQNGREWRADFDWVLKPANALKIDEGRYDRRQAEAAPDPKAFLDDDLPEAMRVRPAAPYFDFEGQVEEVE